MTVELLLWFVACDVAESAAERKWVNVLTDCRIWGMMFILLGIFFGSRRKQGVDDVFSGDFFSMRTGQGRHCSNEVENLL